MEYNDNETEIDSRISERDLISQMRQACSLLSAVCLNLEFYANKMEANIDLTPEQKTDKLESLGAENRLIKSANKQLRKECGEWQNKTFSMKSEIDRMKSQLAGAEDRVRSAEQQADMAFVSMNEFRARVSELEYQLKVIKNQ